MLTQDVSATHAMIVRPIEDQEFPINLEEIKPSKEKNPLDMLMEKSGIEHDDVELSVHWKLTGHAAEDAVRLTGVAMQFHRLSSLNKESSIATTICALHQAKPGSFYEVLAFAASDPEGLRDVLEQGPIAMQSGMEFLLLESQLRKPFLYVVERRADLPPNTFIPTVFFT